MTPICKKSSVEEIRQRFDNEVERFSSLETGQQALPDARLVLDLIAQTASTHLQPGNRILDLGCGAGNLTLRVMQEVGPLDCHFADLSLPMLEKARTRAQCAGALDPKMHQGDLRDLKFEEGSFDTILAAAVLHHLRTSEEWESVFALIHRWLKPGGRFYVSDFVTMDDPKIQEIMWGRYGTYLSNLGGEEYRAKVFDYIDKEDTPRSLPYQLELIRKAGFSTWDVIHRNGVYVCYFAQK